MCLPDLPSKKDVVSHLLAVLSPLQGSRRPALPKVMFLPRQPTSSDWWREGYNGVAISAPCRTTLKGHFSSRLSIEPAKTAVYDSTITQLLLPNPASFPSLLQVLNITALLNILYTELSLKFCFQKTQPVACLLLKLTNKLHPYKVEN